MQSKVNQERELISALADGQLDAHEFAQALDELDQSEDALSAWRTYHLVGEVLRGGEQALSQSIKTGFWAELDRRIESEEHPVKAPYLILDRPQAVVGRSARQTNTKSANDANGGWRNVAGFAFLATGLVFTLGYLSRTPGDSTLASLPRTGAVTIAANPGSGDPKAELMLRDPRLDQLLSDHRQFGGTSALQMPTGFLRNATFEATAR